MAGLPNAHKGKVSHPAEVLPGRLGTNPMMHGAQIAHVRMHMPANADAGNHEKIRGWISNTANPRWKQTCAGKGGKVRFASLSVSA